MEAQGKPVMGYGSDIAVGGDARVCVIGVGGAGCRIASLLYGGAVRVGVVAINTDREALDECDADYRLYICKEVTKGLGTNGDPLLGKKCAQVHEAEIMGVVRNYDVAVIVAGMGGGTGTGAASVIAELCNRAGVSTTAFAIMPFSFESGRALKAAEGYRALRLVCKDSIRIENDKALSAEGVRTFDDALSVVNRAIVSSIANAVDDQAEIIRAKIQKDMAAVDDRSPEARFAETMLWSPVLY